MMKKTYRIFRAFLMAVIAFAVAIPAVLYVALSMPSVQDAIRRRCETEFSRLLGVDVSVRDLGIRPFNRAVLRDVALVSDGDTIAVAGRLGAGINLYELIFHGNITVNYAEIINLDVRICRDSIGEPLNIQPIIDALSSKGTDKPPSAFDFRINTIMIRQSSLSYDVLSEPELPEKFDRNHIEIKDLRADISLPGMANDDFNVVLRRMAFNERSGFALLDFKGNFHVGADGISWSDVKLSMPSTDLLIADSRLPLDGYFSIKESLDKYGMPVELSRGSKVCLSAISPFVPMFSGVNEVLDLKMRSRLSGSALSIMDFSVTGRSGVFSASVKDVTIRGDIQRGQMVVSAPRVTARVSKGLLSYIPDGVISNTVNSCVPEELTFEGAFHGSLCDGDMIGDINVDGGELELDVSYHKAHPDSPVNVSGNIKSRDLDIGKTLGSSDLGTLNADISVEMTLDNGLNGGSVEASMTDFSFRRHSYDDIEFIAELKDGIYNGKISLSDGDATAGADFEGSLGNSGRRMSVVADIDNLDLYAMNLIDRYEGYKLSGNIDACLDGTGIDRGDGKVEMTGLSFVKAGEKGLSIDRFLLTTASAEQPRQIEISSDIINGSVEGDFDFDYLSITLRNILAETFPSLIAKEETAVDGHAKEIGINRFNFSFTINDTEQFREFFNLPVSAIYPVTIDGFVDSSIDYAQVSVDAPYLRQGNKLIENTAIVAVLNGREYADNIYATTQMPTKQGLMTVVFDAMSSNDKVDVSLSWDIERDRRYEGEISLTTMLDRDDSGKLEAEVKINPSQIVFNDSVWTIDRASVLVADSRIEVDNINIHRANQYVKVNGVASTDESDVLSVDVLMLNLDYIFESLGIDKVMLGGDATGRIEASSLFTPAPHIETEGIGVKNISYNKCIMGNALVKSWWDVDTKAVVIDGTIFQDDGRMSKVEGEIYAMSGSLDIRLTADRAQTGFMEAYMSAFASDITGRISGKARLWGSFKDIDMTGDIYAEDLRLKLNFTNTYYSATDSVHISSGEIRLSDVTLSDQAGNTAKMDGVVRHEFFRNPTFDFTISGARNMLVYDESAKQNPDWYGRIYANGGVRVIGEPGVVRIYVDVSTAPGSIFTFVLSELEEADEYTFITFRDKGKLEAMADEAEEDAYMGAVNRLRDMLSRQIEEDASDYIIELRVSITPEAEIDLVMDPVAGDKIRSNGSGAMRVVYASNDNDLRIYGTYTLDHGFYNFTLQDIIIKDFTIKEGSSISFTGDPLVARLDIQAIYALNANLSDLDESFLQDKDLNRTNVPVHALLKVSGDIQQPEIGFDLEFPTLTQDTYRKVRSIVSTEEMMNRQIIYLLTLNRFYTPDYMSSTTKGNELFSVASSTLSSQLSNMLGQLSDNWAIAPNFRSDRGDFSDVEVDVALSSRLLNNRLLLNGNFGYRDKSLNSNQFIGDFDLEYLLNRTGSIRLKAYNHYNDQNYYVRTATTTQGVGVMFKKDFDNLFSFLRRMKKKSALSENNAKSEAPVDSCGVEAPTGKFDAQPDSARCKFVPDY